MAYSSSTNISVFPTVGRPNYDPQGRLTTEYNLTSLLNNLLGVDGFVINNLNDAVYGTGITNKISGDFEFNIKGYIFRIHDISEIINGFKNSIWASITLKIVNGSIDTSTQNITINNQIVQSIEGEDNKDGYTGVTFTEEKPENPNIYTYSIKILEKRSDGNWYIPDSSKVRFKTENNGMRNITIDDGELK